MQMKFGLVTHVTQLFQLTCHELQLVDHSHPLKSALATNLSSVSG